MLNCENSILSNIIITENKINANGGGIFLNFGNNITFYRIYATNNTSE